MAYKWSLGQVTQNGSHRMKRVKLALLQVQNKRPIRKDKKKKDPAKTYFFPSGETIRNLKTSYERKKKKSK